MYYLENQFRFRKEKTKDYLFQFCAGDEKGKGSMLAKKNGFENF